jgi:membrane associated rhomboid family serine protease
MPRNHQPDWIIAVETSATVIGVLFLVRAAEVTFRLPLGQLGIVPRTVTGLAGIVFSPLLHASASHLVANSLPLFVLLALLLSNRQYHPYRSLALIWGASGLGTWLIGRGHSVHLGASSIVFGLAAFLIVAGLRMKSWRSAAVAILVVVLYGGIFYGALPQAGPISWEGHLCGAIAGAWTARNLRA